MPITQSRMLALLDEYERLRTHYAHTLSDLRVLARTSELTPQMKLMALSDLADELALPSAPTYWRERTHFERARARNERSAQRMRQVRQRKGERDGLDGQN